MIPIVFALVPTIIGAGTHSYSLLGLHAHFSIAMLVGLNDSGNKGALLFGAHDAFFTYFGLADRLMYSYVYYWYLRKCTVYGVCIQCQQYCRTYQEGRTLRVSVTRANDHEPAHNVQSTVNSLTLATFSVGNIIGSDKFTPLP